MPSSPGRLGRGFSLEQVPERLVTGLQLFLAVDLSHLFEMNLSPGAEVRILDLRNDQHGWHPQGPLDSGHLAQPGEPVPTIIPIAVDS